MRVLQVINSVDPIDGGPAEIAMQLCSSLSELGDEPELLVTRTPPHSVLARLGRVPVHSQGPAIGRYSYSRNAQRWLSANATRFDAVVIHGIWQHCAVSAAVAARASRVPYFVYPHGALDGELPAIYPIRHAKKVAYWHLVGRSLLVRAAGVCFTSDAERDRAVGFRGRWTSIVIGAGIEDPPAVDERDKASLLSRFPTLAGQRVVLYMGRLVPLKGADMLIRAFSRARTAAPECRLVIAGSGTPAYERRLAGIARGVRCDDAVIFAGALEGAAKWAALDMAELFVSPSHRDSFGVSVVEALAAGTPVLVTRSVGVAPVVERCQAGVVCVDNESDLASALQRMLSVPIKATMQVAARRCYEENFSAMETARRLKAAMTRAREGARPIS